VNQHLREVGIDAPVVSFVGVGQRGTRHLAPEAHVIQLALDRKQAGFDVTEAFAVGELCESETEKLVKTGKAAEFVIASAASHTLLELMRRQVLDHLSEDGPACEHAPLSEAWSDRKVRREN
jgi:hypothetical protein